MDDAVEAFLLAGASDQVNGQVMNLGGTEPVSLITLVETLVKVADAGSFRVEEFPEERRRIDIGDFYADYALIRQELGWEPTVGLEEGLRRTVGYYKKYREQYWS